MTADQHDLVGEVGALDFADHVVGQRLHARARLQLQRQPRHHATLVQTGDQVGVGRRDREGRDARHLQVIAHRAGVRDAVAVSADRADAHRQRAALAAFDGTGRARADRRAVAAAVARTLHLLVDEDDAALGAVAGVVAQRLDARVPGQLGLDAAGRCGHAVAQRRHHQRLRVGVEQSGLRGTALPHLQRHRLGADVVELQPLHCRQRPGHGACIGRRAGRPRANLGGQRLHQLPGLAVGAGQLAQLQRLGEVAIGVGKVGGHARAGQGEGGGEVGRGVDSQGGQQFATLHRAVTSPSASRTRRPCRCSPASAASRSSAWCRSARLLRRKRACRRTGCASIRRSHARPSAPGSAR